MKKILSILLLVAGVCISANAQVKAGDIVSGQIWDDLEPLMMVNVVEIDHNNRIVAAGVTDINGNFSFKIVNPKDKIRISYIGCETKVLPITKKSFGKIVLANQTQLKEVVVKAVKKTQTSGLSIPVTEISVAQQTIDMKEFEGLAMTSVDEALQGRISGLDIVANSGNLGSGTTMRLRGVSTINGNAEPLIVVNGNVFDTSNANAAQDFDYANANEEKFAELLSVNPEDIESISVLKDAAATAIWGSQGANGVIEIKTKRGSRGKTKVQYSYRFSGSWQPKGYNLLKGDDYTMYLKEAYFNTTQNPEFATAGSTNYIPEIAYNKEFSEYQMYNNNTDWVDAVTQFGQNHQHYIALTGGGEKANFRISGGYDHATGTVIKQVLNRFTTRVALDYFVSDRIKVSSNFDLTHTKNQKNYQYGGRDLMAIALNKMPNLSIYQQDADGNDMSEYYTMNPYLTAAQAGYNAASGQHSGQSDLLKDQYAMPNPVAVGHMAKRDWTELKLSPEFILQYDILGTEPDQTRLRYEGQIVFDIYSRGEDTYFPGSLIATNWSSSDTYNAASAYSYKQHGMSTRHTLTFTPHFRNEDHSLQFMARFNYTNGSSSDQTNGQKWLPSVDGITSPLAGGIITSFSTGAGEWKSQFFLFSLHYAYKGRYIFDATLRRDASTKFGPSSRWGNFPGLSARWNISDEPWMKWAENWLSMLSVRPGWGIVGNQPGKEGMYYSKYSTGGSYLGTSSVYPANIRLAALKWEKTETYNLGFDFGFFDGMIDGDLSLYTKKTTQLLHSGFSIPSSSGYGSLDNKNEGTIRNVGWEFNINGHRLLKMGKFSMDFNITFANSRNKIIDMDETLLEGKYNDDFKYNNGTYLSRVQLNNPLGSVYGFRSKGVYAYSNIPKVRDRVTGVESYVDMDMSEIDKSKYIIMENGGKNAPVVRTTNGDVVYNASGTPKKMIFDYNNGTNYEFVGGDAIYEDINSDGTIDELDIVYLGSTLPKLTGGFGVKFNYGPWSMNLQFNYRYGNKCINYARMGIESMADNSNQSQAVNWRWHTEGEEALLPRAATTKTGVNTYNYLGSDRFVEDASFLRLNYAQLSYTFTPQSLKKIGISSLRLNLIVNNVFVITKYSGADPEHPQGGYAPASDSGQTPRAKSFTVGASISF